MKTVKLYLNANKIIDEAKLCFLICKDKKERAIVITKNNEDSNALYEKIWTLKKNDFLPCCLEYDQHALVYITQNISMIEKYNYQNVLLLDKEINQDLLKLINNIKCQNIFITNSNTELSSNKNLFQGIMENDEIKFFAWKFDINSKSWKKI